MVLLFAIAIAMRLHGLGTPQAFDLDEGVYWETLRAMHASSTLYRDIYFSQPPLFMGTVYPFYLLFGQNIFAARLGIALLSLLGLGGLYLIGRVAGGTWGGLAALLLGVASPAYLAMSQTLQAEAPAIGFSVLSVGLAFAAFRGSTTRTHIGLAALSGVTLAVALVSKFLAVASVAPILVLLAMHMRTAMRPALAFCVGFSAAIAVVAAIFAPEMHALITQVVAFHLSAESAFHARGSSNVGQVASVLVSPLGTAALLGAVCGSLRRNWSVLPMAAWVVAAAIMLLNLVPLFIHHLVALAPPLIGLAALTFAPVREQTAFKGNVRIVEALGVVAFVVAVGAGAFGENSYFHNVTTQRVYGSRPDMDARAVHDLSTKTKPGERVVTDAQFLTALADRDTPPWFVDTTLVRVDAGQLTERELIENTADPKVHAVLFYGNRLARNPGYKAWVERHFHVAERYDDGNKLMLR